jgi:hypothetical protein
LFLNLDDMHAELHIPENLVPHPATEEMVEKAILELVHQREAEVFGEDGTLRNARKAIQEDYVLRLSRQRPIYFFGQ